LPGIPANRAEIRRAEECRDVRLPVRDELHPEARKTLLVLHARRIDAALFEIEHRGLVDDLVRKAVDDLEHAHGLGEAAPDVKKLDAKRIAVVRPECVIRAEAQRLVLVVAQVGEPRRQGVFRRHV
jgi:hypothetical protein